MCGIAGFVRRDGGPAAAEVGARMIRTLAHRGPDGEGVWSDGPAVLAHRRLSIIDLSDRARQPMSDAAGAVWITYNGKIYNYKPLRRELEARGHAFRTTSDTEVVLEAYRAWGPECVRRLVGMFAFAIWDGAKRQLLLVRDPLGVKPLFYAMTDTVIAFGSEAKAVLASGIVTPRIDPDGLLDCLTFAAVIAPRTMFAGIRQLPPAHVAIVSAAGMTLSRYWSPLGTTYAARSDDEWVEGLRERMARAVSGALQSDVPFGVLLSGGVDSSAVARFACDEHHGSLPAFTMGFDEPSFDESAVASRAARDYGMKPFVGRVDAGDLASLVPRVVWHSEEATPNASFVATWQLAQLATSQVKMALSGDGPDELLAGYETYRATLMAERVRRVTPATLLRGLGHLADLAPGGFRKRASIDSLRRFLYGATRPGLDRHGVWRHIVRAEQIDRVVADTSTVAAARRRDPVADAYGTTLASERFASPLQALLYADTTVYLPNDGLVKMDRMGMAHGLEVRVPFLNHDVVEYAFAMPDHLKLGRDGTGKVALRRMLAGRVNGAILCARKMGFNAPASAWLRGPLREFARDTLSARSLDADGLFRAAAIEPMLRRHTTGVRDYSWVLWTVLGITLWYRTFVGPHRACLAPTAA